MNIKNEVVITKSFHYTGHSDGVARTVRLGTVKQATSVSERPRWVTIPAEDAEELYVEPHEYIVLTGLAPEIREQIIQLAKEGKYV